jgi:hypothetical protein
MLLIVFAYSTGDYLLLLSSRTFLFLIVMAMGLYLMSGHKLRLSFDFWRDKFGAGHPLFFGLALDFYIFMAVFAYICIVALIFVAPHLIQRLFVLLIGNTAVCLLLYFRLKNRRKLE